MTEPDTVVRNAAGILTGARAPNERRSGSIRIRNGRIAEIGDVAFAHGERTIDAGGCVIYPGLINAHHHLFQSVLKGVAAGLNVPFDGWVREVLFRYWYRFDERALEVAATIGIAELVLSGTTTVADHHFLFSDDDRGAADVLFAVAKRFGIRFVLARGGATRAAEAGGAGLRSTPWESLDAMIERVAAVAARYHDAAPDALTRVAFAPSTPLWSVEAGELRTIAAAARGMGVRLHTHLSETVADVDACVARYGERPVPWLARHDWLGDDVWFAHGVHLDAAELAQLARTQTGLAHCAQSNARLGVGIAPAVPFAALGGRVALGVDGAASNEAGSMLAEMHGAWQVQRAANGAAALRAEEVVRWASAGGAEVLGLPALGTIEVGKAADLAVFALDDLRYAGLHDRALGPVIAGSGRVRTVLVGGRAVVVDGAIPGLDLARLHADAAAVVERLCA